MNFLLHNGINFNHVHHPVTIFCFTCDSPARSGLKGVVQHTGYYACERCDLKGKYVRHRIVYDQDAPKGVARTDQVFRTDGYGEPDEEGKRHQLEESGLTPLLIDLIKDVAIDPMHLVYLGVTRRLLYYMKGSYKNIRNGKLSSAYLNAITIELSTLKLPAEFARQPRGLSELDRWKATEFKSFLLYTGITILRRYLSPAVWTHFMSFSIAIRLLSEENDTIRNSNLLVAENLLKDFITSSHNFYGETFCVYNVHNLIHLVEDVAYFQLPLIRYSCFQFENHLQKIKSLVRGRNNPLAQIVKRTDELDGSYYLNVPLTVKVKSDQKNSFFLNSTYLFIIRKLENDGSVLCDTFPVNTLQSFFNVSNVDSKVLGIYVLKRTFQATLGKFLKEDLSKKCVCLPCGNDFIIIPLL